MDEPEQGRTHVRTVEVTDALTAVAYGSGDVPVLATPAVLALAEETCVELLTDHLDPGETSVGTFALVRHDRATPVGRTVTVEARLLDREGPRLVFEVAVFEGDEHGQVVATVDHRRVVVDRQLFLERTGAAEG